MVMTSVLLVGGPDSGKTNYLGRVWAAVREADAALHARAIPQDIRYVDQALACLLQGEFAPRTEASERAERSFSVTIKRAKPPEVVDVIVPDVSGELWREAVRSYALAPEWMRRLEEATGVLLFVRVGSNQNI